VHWFEGVLISSWDLKENVVYANTVLSRTQLRAAFSDVHLFLSSAKIFNIIIICCIVLYLYKSGGLIPFVYFIEPCSLLSRLNGSLLILCNCVLFLLTVYYSMYDAQCVGKNSIIILSNRQVLWNCNLK